MESTATAASTTASAAAAARRREQRRVPNEKRKRAANALVFAYQGGLWLANADMRITQLRPVQSAEEQMYTIRAWRLPALSHECLIVRVFRVRYFSGMPFSITKLIWGYSSDMRVRDDGIPAPGSKSVNARSGPSAARDSYSTPAGNHLPNAC